MSPSSGSLQEARLRKYRLQLQRFLVRDKGGMSNSLKSRSLPRKMETSRDSSAEHGSWNGARYKHSWRVVMSVLQEANKRMKDEEIYGNMMKMLKNDEKNLICSNRLYNWLAITLDPDPRSRWAHKSLRFKAKLKLSEAIKYDKNSLWVVYSQWPLLASYLISG